jgi:hypothetical protein
MINLCNKFITSGVSTELRLTRGNTSYARMRLASNGLSISRRSSYRLPPDKPSIGASGT